MATYVQQINGNPIFAARAESTRTGVNIDSKFAAIEQEITSMGAFEVVSLTSGENPVPDVTDPSTKVIYLTKDSESTATDPYTEWIYIAGTPSGTWEIIGETTLDLSGYKTKQTAVSVTGGTLKGVASFTQNENGDVTLTLNDIQDGTTSQKGVVQLQDSIGATETTDTKAATPKSVRDAINALDATVASAGDTGVSPNFGLSVTEADGKITGVTVTSDSTENVTNKVTSWTTTTTDTHYPSEKLVKDSLDNKADIVRGGTSGNFAGLDSNGNLTDSGSKANDFKPKQAAVSDPTVSGTATAFISSISQDANGVITPSKAALPAASTSVAGITSLSSAHDSTADDVAATPKAVKDAYDLADSAIQGIKVDSTALTPDSNKIVSIPTATTSASGTVQLAGSIGATVATENNKAASEKAVRDAIDGLNVGNKADKVANAVSGNFAGLDTNGNLTDSGSKAADFAVANHTHGQIENDGKIGTTADLSVVTGTGGAVTTANLTTADPSVPESGITTAVSFIDTISQDSKGKITATKKTVQDASASQAGLMSAADYTKLSGIEAGAQVNVIDAVKVNNVALTPDENKAVNIPLASYTPASEGSPAVSVTGVVTYTTIDLD